MTIKSRITYIVLLSDFCLRVGGGDNFYPAEMIKGEKRLTLTRTYCYRESAREVTEMSFFPSAL